MSEKLLTRQVVTDLYNQRHASEIKKEQLERQRLEKENQLIDAHQKEILASFKKSIDTQIRNALCSPNEAGIVCIDVPISDHLYVPRFREVFLEYVSQDLGFTLMQCEKFPTLLGSNKTWFTHRRYESKPWYKFFSERKVIGYSFYVAIDVSDLAIRGFTMPLTPEELP